MAGQQWLWVVGVKLWLVVGRGDKSMADHGWWQQNYAWSWVVVGDGDKIMDGHGWSHDLLMHFTFINFRFLTKFMLIKTRM